MRAGVDGAIHDGVEPLIANDNPWTSAAIVGVADDRIDWHPVADLPPLDCELLLWVHGPFIGCWRNAEGGYGVDKTTCARLQPVAFWAHITGP